MRKQALASRTILICTGSHCRKRARKRARLEAGLAGLAVRVEHVGCQKVCRGPVVGLELQGEWQWFGRMGSRKAVAALAELVEDGRLRERLRKRLDHRRTGKRRP